MQHVQSNNSVLSDNSGLAQSLVRRRRCLETMIGVPFVDGNDVRLLQNGVEIFPAMLEAIRAATNTVDLLTYVYWSGDIARKFCDVLVTAANNGKRVRILLDSFGAAKMPDELVDRLRNSGAELRWFRPLHNWRIWQNDKRTHRKILVVDDRIGFSGGVGIADEWTGDARNADEWRETHFSLAGPAVRGLKSAFLDNWNEAGEWTLDDSENDDTRFDSGMPVQIVRASSTIGWSAAATLLRSLVAVAQRSLTLVTPYFVPDDKLEQLLASAVQRGVRVSLMIPGKHCDMRLPQLAGQTSIEWLLDAGVRIWRYQRTNLHAKLAIVDGCISCIGSANLNHRSMGKDEECCAVFLSESVAASLMRRFSQDCEHAELLELQKWRNRGIWLRTKERLARTLVEEL